MQQLDVEVVDDGRVVQGVCSVEPQKRALEREVLRYVRDAQDAKRVLWKPQLKPHWWQQGAQMHLKDIHDAPVAVPKFHADVKKTWSLQQLQVLLALAIRAELRDDDDDSDPNASPTSSSSHHSSERHARGKRVSSGAILNLKEEVEAEKAHEGSQGQPASASEQVPEPRAEQTSETSKQKRGHEELSASPVKSLPSGTMYEGSDDHARASRQPGKRSRTIQRIDNIMEEIDVEIDARCSELRTLSQNAAFSIRNAYRVQMMKLPRKVRSLPLREFVQEYGGQLNNVLLKDMESSVAQALRRRPRNQMLRRPVLSQRPIPQTGSQQSSASHQTRSLRDEVASRYRQGSTASAAHEKENRFPTSSEPFEFEDHQETWYSTASTHKTEHKAPPQKEEAFSAANKVEQLQQLAALQRQVADMISALASN
ncbi:hypothetical protein FVE85_0412 [Porphyridium purpureum]|uniref:Borealin N-terminal domain-containing protein n=1 Tax=Porphyridium purpureum TaxID=35688 RepID=A0A5J4Z1C8_PORPP|nr:hypothetical protein FVE85_0412 [Porphyridium purpureum]|eukprot:POR1611..scf208_2